MQVCTESQLTHADSSVEKEDLDCIAHVSYTDSEAEAEAEGVTGWLALRTGGR